MNKKEFRKMWLKAFAPSVSKDKIKKYVEATGNYIWHVFSWELLDESLYLSGDEARKAYDEMDKQGVLYIQWRDDGKVRELPFEMYTAKALDEIMEIYVVANDFSWTYIKTHEDMCGPYFAKCNFKK